MDTLFQTIWKMSMQGSLIFLVILFLRFIMTKIRIAHKYIVVLWMLLFFYLVFPFKISMPGGFWQEKAVGVSKMTTQTENEYVAHHIDNVIVENDMAKEQAVNVEISKADNGVYMNFTRIIPYIWAGTFVTLIVHFIYSYMVIKRRVAIHVATKDGVFLVEKLQTPMVFGFFRQNTFLPIEIAEETADYVIAHEKMHVKRQDFRIKVIAYVITLIHWFNPIIWIAYYLLGMDMEKACDEAVMKELDTNQKKEYAYVLLAAATQKLHKGNRFVAPICFNEGDVKGRIKNLKNYKTTLPIVAIITVLVILLLGIAFVTKKENKPKQSTEMENVQEVKNVQKDDAQNESEDVMRGEFEDILGYDGYYVTDKTTIFPFITYYYAIENGEEFCIAESHGEERNDYAVDIDGDGVKELICNVIYGDGAERTYIYRREENRILKGYAEELLDEEYDFENIGSIRSFYLPKENVVEIQYWKADIQDYLSKKYEVDLKKITYWEEYPAPEAEHNPIAPLLTEPPQLKLVDMLSSSLNYFTVTAGTYSWNYPVEEGMNAVEASGAVPTVAVQNQQNLEMPDYNGVDFVPYRAEWEVWPDKLVLKEYDISDLGKTNAKCIYESTLPDDSMLELKPGKIYELCVEWSEESYRQEINRFYGNAYYAFATGDTKADIQTSVDQINSVTLNMEKYTPNDGYLEIHNFTGKELMYGDWYKIQKKVDENWSDLDYVVENVGFHDIAYTAPHGEVSVKEVDWSLIYGTLQPGTYKIVTKVMDFHATGDFEEYYLEKVFEIK